MKKFLLMVLSCLIILSFAACSDKDNGEEISNSTDSSVYEDSSDTTEETGGDTTENNGGEVVDDRGFTANPGNDDNTDNWTKDYPIANK